MWWWCGCDGRCGEGVVVVAVVVVLVVVVAVIDVEFTITRYTYFLKKEKY